VVVVLELEAALVLVAVVKSNFLPSTFTEVAGALPKLNVTLVVPLGSVKEWVVALDKVPCQVVVPPTLTAIQALPVADKLSLGFDEAFFISQVEPDVVELIFLKLAVEVFLDEDFLDELFLELLLALELLPETLTELLSTLLLVEELLLREAAIQIPTKTAKTTMTIPTMGTVRRSLT